MNRRLFPMNAATFADYVVDFDPDTNKHVCHQTTQTLDCNPLPVRLLFPDRAAFVRHRDRYGRIRVVFYDCERIVRGIAGSDDLERDAVGGHATDERRVGNDVVILSRPILYCPAENAVRETVAAIKRR
jgi:hypothetical protein